jgi:hypothetical protein
MSHECHSYINMGHEKFGCVVRGEHDTHQAMTPGGTITWPAVERFGDTGNVVESKEGQTVTEFGTH